MFCDEQQKIFLSRLVKIGKLETPKSDRYQSGQLFIHKLFGYRGLIVLPWIGQVFDRYLYENPDETNIEVAVINGRKVKYYTKNCYQVFIDSRDRPFVRTLNEVGLATTVSGTSRSYRSRLLNYAPGLDYVAHEDIIPYNATEQIPIKHEMVGEYFNLRPGNCLEPGERFKKT